jgi:membrane-bound lytic murein transglycosylase D
MVELHSRTAAGLVAGACLLLLVALLPEAFAQSRQQRAVDTLDQRMQAAEQRYRAALVRIGNNDPAGTAEADAALEDMEDVIVACGNLRGCHPATMLAAWKRLLKQQADGQGVSLDEDDPLDPDPDHRGVVADVPEAARAAYLLDDKDHRFDDMVRLNPAVQAGIRRWLTDMRPALMNSHENYQYMRHLMWPYYERAGLPEALLFGIMAKESNGRVHSVSRAGAAGPMQFMYATGLRFGLGPDGSGFDTRYDPRASAEASVAYLNERLRELNNSIELALAGYNGGEGRARRVFQASGGRDFWDAQVYNQFPAETQDYVPMVIAAAWIFLHPKQYGVEFPKVDPRPAQLRLQAPASIYSLTICLGNAGSRDGYMRALRNLNPRYQADTYLPAGTTLHASSDIARLYQRWCVRGPRAQLAQELVSSNPQAAIVHNSAPLPPASPRPTAAAIQVSAPPPARRYSVQRGETLQTIARKFECDLAVLTRANGLDNPRVAVRTGQELALEGCGG